MNNFTAPVCSVCKKLLFTSLLLQWNGNTYQQIPLLDGVPIPKDHLCQGHTSVECPTCGWMVCDGYHTPDDCARLAGIVGKKRTEIPRAFYDAFDEEIQG